MARSCFPQDRNNQVDASINSMDIVAGDDEEEDCCCEEELDDVVGKRFEVA